jgi:Flp pilus assembly protein TadG
VRSAKTRYQSRGQALVEFALVAPVFFLILFAVIEGGRFILYYETLNNATREGARYAIVNGANSLCTATSGPTGPMPADWTKAVPACLDVPGARVVQRVKDSAFGLLGNTVTVTPQWLGPNGNARDSRVRVEAVYSYKTLVPLLPLPQITIRAESNLVINN